MKINDEDTCAIYEVIRIQHTIPDFIGDIVHIEVSPEIDGIWMANAYVSFIEDNASDRGSLVANQAFIFCAQAEYTFTLREVDIIALIP